MSVRFDVGGVNLIIVNCHLAAHLEQMAERIEVCILSIYDFIRSYLVHTKWSELAQWFGHCEKILKTLWLFCFISACYWMM